MKALLRWIGLVAFAALALELFFVLRIAAMAVVNPNPPPSSAPKPGPRSQVTTPCAGASNGCPTHRSAATSNAP